MSHWLRSKTKDLLIEHRYSSIRYPLVAAIPGPAYSPFFIMGSGRSGTTIMRKILESNQQLVIPPESGSLLEDSIKMFILENNQSWRSIVEQIFRLWTQSPDFTYWELEGYLDYSEILALPDDKRSLQNIIAHFYKTYAQHHKPEATMWGDKTPYATFGLKWLKLLYPEGRIIHMIRDGRDVVNSLMKHGRSDSIQDACDRWNRSIDILTKPLGTMSILDIRYENLVSNPEKALDLVSQFLGTDLDLNKLDTPSFLGDDHLPHHQNLKNEINQRAVGNWDKELSEEQIDEMMPLISKNLQKLGYV